MTDERYGHPAAEFPMPVRNPITDVVKTVRGFTPLDYKKYHQPEMLTRYLDMRV